jgi:hypothetical protein
VLARARCFGAAARGFLESPMKTLLMIVGLIAFAAGLVWAGEGLGYLNTPLPFMPPMFGVRLWAYYGGAVALLGLLIVRYSRSRR